MAPTFTINSYTIRVRLSYKYNCVSTEIVQLAVADVIQWYANYYYVFVRGEKSCLVKTKNHNSPFVNHIKRMQFFCFRF